MSSTKISYQTKTVGKKNRKRKRKQPLNRSEMEKKEKEDIDVSASKVNRSSMPADISIDDSIGYVILNFIGVFSALSDSVKCKCGKRVKFYRANVQGLGFNINVSCETCPVVSIPCCPQQHGSFEINRRIILALRLLGIGLEGMIQFCGIMDLPRPVFRSDYNAIVKSLEATTKAVCKVIMRQSVENEKRLTKEKTKSKEIDGLIVSSRGTSKEDNYSLLTISSIIGNYSGKILDIFIKSASCDACFFFRRKGKTADYAEWKADHENICPGNQQKCAKKMDGDNICEMFARSEENYKLKYSSYIGDALSKTYKAVINSAPYTVSQKQCINHLQKRMMRLLQNCKYTNDLGDELPGKLIDELSINYGNAIKENAESIENMRDAIWAKFFHECSTDEEPKHHYCQEGFESSCTWQQAKAKGTLHDYKHKAALHEDVIPAIHIIYQQLTSNDLLEKCIGAFTQTSGRKFDNLVWGTPPGEYDSEDEIMNIDAYVGVCRFNVGLSAFMSIMEAANIKVGNYCALYCQHDDEPDIDTE